MGHKPCDQPFEAKQDDQLLGDDDQLLGDDDQLFWGLILSWPSQGTPHQNGDPHQKQPGLIASPIRGQAGG